MKQTSFPLLNLSPLSDIKKTRMSRWHHAKGAAKPKGAPVIPLPGSSISTNIVDRPAHQHSKHQSNSRKANMGSRAHVHYNPAWRGGYVIFWQVALLDDLCFHPSHWTGAAAHPEHIPHDLAVHGVIVADLAYILPLMALCLLIFERLFMVMRTGAGNLDPPFSPGRSI